MSIDGANNNIRFFGLTISTKVDLIQIFCKYSSILFDKWLAIYRSLPPAEDSVGVCSKN